MLSLAIRASGVDVPDAGSVSGIEHLVAAALECPDTSVCPEIFLSSGIDVGGPAERRKAKPEPAHGQSGRSKFSDRYSNVRHDVA
jgi:hypothetical protein